MTAANAQHRQAADRAVILACIRRCTAAPDERGRWRPEVDCIKALLANGHDQTTATGCAGAARRIGAYLAGVRA